MSKIKFELDRQGVSELLTGDDMQQLLWNITETIRSSLGDGYENRIANPGTRLIGIVTAVDEEAIEEQYESNLLLKALNGNFSEVKMKK